MPAELLSCLTLLAFFSPPDCQVADLDRFPDFHAAYAGRALAWQCYYVFRDNQAPIASWKREAYYAALRNVERRHQVWEDLWQARYYQRFDQSDAAIDRLRSLRRIIGEDAYRLGILPAPIP